MSADTPSWLTNDQPSVITTPAPAPTPSAPLEVDRAGPSSQSDYGVTESDDKDLPGVILTMRLANMGVAAYLMTVSILLMISIPGVSTFVLAIYATCGGLLICCLETQLKFLRVMIAVNFGFLFNSIWRFLFYMILGSVAWSYDDIFGQSAAIALACVAIFNTYVLCRYPSYRKIRERIAEEEDKRIEARISKEVKKQAINQMAK